MSKEVAVKLEYLQGLITGGFLMDALQGSLIWSKSSIKLVRVLSVRTQSAAMQHYLGIRSADRNLVGTMDGVCEESGIISWRFELTSQTDRLEGVTGTGSVTSKSPS